MDITHNKKIDDLVRDNYVYAKVLNYFGIKFYQYSEKTLEQACKERGLNLNYVIASLESVGTESDPKQLLIAFPVDIIMEYLKHMHFLFVKQRLPYIYDLIANWNHDLPQYNAIIKDLKLVFPLFVEDFIHHMHQEEDTLFSYILNLNQAISKSQNPSQLYQQMEKNSIQTYAVEHDAHDDEMKGIRKITKHYHLSPHDDLHLKVLYAELQSFERELTIHAKVENEILFPKALMLEKEVKQILGKRVSCN